MKPERSTTNLRTLLALLFAFALVAAACGSDGAEDTDAGASDDSSETTEAASDDDDAMEDDAMEDEESHSDDAMEDDEAMEEDAMEDDGAADDAAASGAYPVTVNDDFGEITIEAQPMRIVSMSPSATEMLFAIGAGDQVVAADSYSNFPAEAPTTDLSAFEPSIEAIAAQEPDLVILSFDTGEIASGLADIGVPTLVYGAAVSVDDVYRQIAELGIATDHIDEAAAVNAEIREGIDAVVANVDPGAEPVRVYHELDDTFYSASSNSFIGELYSLLGVENIADPADSDGFGFPQLSPEYLIEADPQVIVFTNQVGYSADDIAARPGWETMSAVANGNLVEVDADVASRWGPRIVEFLEIVSAELSKVPAGS